MADQHKDVPIQILNEIGPEGVNSHSRGPANEGVVEVRDTGTLRGRGLFALQDLPTNQVVLSEGPLFLCQASARRTRSVEMEDDWRRLRMNEKEELRNLFPDTLGGLPIDGRLHRSDRQKLRKFIAKYAFQIPGSQHRACTYRQTCLMNHACRDCANCSVLIDPNHPHHATVRLLRPVQTNQELLVNYGNRVPFRCASCGPDPTTFRLVTWAWMHKVGLLWNRL